MAHDFIGKYAGKGVKKGARRLQKTTRMTDAEYKRYMKKNPTRGRRGRPVPKHKDVDLGG